MDPGLATYGVNIIVLKKFGTISRSLADGLHKARGYCLRGVYPMVLDLLADYGGDDTLIP